MINRQVSFRKPEGKRPLARPRRRWEENIKIVLKNMMRRCELDPTNPEQGPVAGFCERSIERRCWSSGL
jgi:hypothetical protein